MTRRWEGAEEALFRAKDNNVITGTNREMVETVDTKNVTFCRKGGLDKQIRRLEARRCSQE